MFRSNDGPKYIKAWVVHIVVYGVQLATIILLRLRLMRLNALKRRAQGLKESRENGDDSVSVDKSPEAYDRHCNSNSRQSTFLTNTPSTTLRIRRTLIVSISLSCKLYGYT